MGPPATVPQELPADSPYRATLATLTTCEEVINNLCTSNLTESRLADLKNCENMANRFIKGSYYCFLCIKQLFSRVWGLCWKKRDR